MIDEKHDLLNTYINLGNKIKQLEWYYKAISDNYYKSHSIVSGTVMGDNGEVYQRALSPFIVTWDIIKSETIITQRIERLVFRYRYFKRFCDTLDVEQLKRLKTFKNDEINDTQKLALDEIQEIEEATAWRFYNGVMVDEDLNPLEIASNADRADILTAIEILQGELFS